MDRLTLKGKYKVTEEVMVSLVSEEVGFDVESRQRWRHGELILPPFWHGLRQPVCSASEGNFCLQILRSPSVNTIGDHGHDSKTAYIDALLFAVGPVAHS